MKLLFIGGVADGLLREIDRDVTYVKVPQRTTERCGVHGNDIESVMLIDTYNKKQIRGEYEIYEVMLHNNLTMDHAVLRLLIEYHISRSK